MLDWYIGFNYWILTYFLVHLISNFYYAESCKSVQEIHCSCAVRSDGLLCSCFRPSLLVGGIIVLYLLYHCASNITFFLRWLTTQTIDCSSAGAMKNTPLKLSYVYQCTGCDSFHLQPIGRTVTKVCCIFYLSMWPSWCWYSCFLLHYLCKYWVIFVKII